MKLLCCESMVTLMGLVLSHQAPGATRLGAPSREILLPQRFVDQPIPIWQNGYFLTYDATVLVSPNVYLYNSAGTLSRKIKVAIPETVQNDVLAVSISTQGIVAVSGGARNVNGRESAYVAWYSKSGELERIVQSNPFIAYHLCFTGDGKLWALGREQQQYGGNEQSHNVLYHFSENGLLLNSVLPLASFPTIDRHPAVQALLVSGKDRVGIYSEPAKEWVEVGLSGEVIGRWRGAETSVATSFRVRGAALVPSGLVYVSAVIQDGPKGPSRAQIFTLNRANGTWESVDLAGKKPEETALIAGSDGGQLVVTKRLPSYGWVSPE